MNSKDLTRLERLENALLKNKAELKIINLALDQPFALKSNRKKINDLTNYENYKSNAKASWIIWLLAISLWGLVFFQFSIENLLITLISFSVGAWFVIYIRGVIQINIFLRKRKKEIEENISIMKRKIKNLS